MHLPNGEPDVLVNRAGMLLHANRPEEAEELCRAALHLDPENLPGRVMLGMLLSRKGDQLGAIEQLDRVLRVEPGLFEALMWRSTAARIAGDAESARMFAERAVRAGPDQFHAYHNLGLCLMSQGNCVEAIANFRRCIALNPNFARAHFSLGTALHYHGSNHEAIEAYQRTLALARDFTEALVSLGIVHQALGNTEDALKYAKRAIKLAPQSAAAHLFLASLSIDLGDAVEAKRHWEIASSLEGSDQSHAYLKGSLLRSLGRLEEANELFRKDIEARPIQGSSYCYLAYGQRTTEEDRPMVEAMRRVASDHPLAIHESAALNYGLGRALEDLGEYEESMRHYDTANLQSHRIQFGDASFDVTGFSWSHDTLISLLVQGAIERAWGEGDPSETPIFVIGMMRSGTTLVEHILSCHSLVAAGGEQPFWPGNWSRIIDPETGEISGARARELAKEYLESIARFRQGAIRVTDKMPRNYAVAGAIRLAFPKARIVHMRRHPVDTCLSIYTTPNRATVEYAHSRRGIVAGYQEYQRLMSHWESVLPEGNMLTIDYEGLVADRERVIRELVEFCGLPWEDACLSHELNPRSVATPSAWQVRQPMYATSVGRWRRFESWLGEFRYLMASREKEAFDLRALSIL